MKAKTYTLTAELGSVKCTRTFEQVNDDAAAMEAVGFVLDEAHMHPKGPWALGEINLMNAKGRILQHMDAKVAA